METGHLRQQAVARLDGLSARSRALAADHQGVGPARRLGNVGAVATPVRWGSVLLYTALAFGLAWAAFIGLRAAGVPFMLRAGAGMYGPLAAALLTRLVLGEGFDDVGLRLSRRGRPDSTYLLAYLVPLALLASGVGLALVVGGQRWALVGNWAQYLAAQVRAAGAPGATVARVRDIAPGLLPVGIAQILVISVLVNCLFTVGEEVGWRGHLLVRLLGLGPLPASLLVGVVWGLWHAPLIGLDGYEYGLRSWAAAPILCLFTVPVAVVLAWLRLRSGSVWPCVLAHAAINAPAALVLLSLSRPASMLVAPPVGVLGVLPWWAFAAWLVATGRLPLRAREAEVLAAPVTAAR
jgi:membrane protease YdiL (CAAX protease family)